MGILFFQPLLSAVREPSDDYKPKEVPALPSFKLHKFVSDKIIARGLEYRTGVVYTTNRRVWEWDDPVQKIFAGKLSTLAIDMETATLFIVGLVNEIHPRCFAACFGYPNGSGRSKNWKNQIRQ
ncbi:MAG: hypothetical protein MZV64_61675 [Ignavibacteriales bacterium]|nr:hypothetical protein [Ignavibacteriales bacterium]